MDIASKFDVSKYPEPQRATVLAALTEIVQMKLARELYTELTPDEQAMLDNQDEVSDQQAQQMWEFFRGRFPNLEARIVRLVKETETELDGQLQSMIELIHKQEPNAG